MKKLCISFFILCAFYSNAQIAVKLIQFRPTGELGMTMSKEITGELMYLSKFDNNWRMRGGISYVSFTPRMESFPVYAIMEDANGTTVLPGYQVFHKCNMTDVFFGVDYAFLDKEKFYAYGGADIMMGSMKQNYDLSYETYKNESNDLGLLLGGLRFRLGAEYFLSQHFGVFFELTRAVYAVEESGFYSNNDIGLGLHYIIN